LGPNWRTSPMPAIATGQSKSESSTGAINLQRQDGASSASLPSVASTDAISALNGQPRLTTPSRELAATQRVVQANPLTPADQTISLPEAAASASKTWALPEIKQDESSTTGAYKLTGPARIVSIPVAGQPGQYITGILPSSPQPVSMPLVGLPASAPAPSTAPAQAPVKHPLLQRWRVPIFVLAALLVVCGSLGFVFIHSALSHHPVGLATPTTAGTPNIASQPQPERRQPRMPILSSPTRCHKIFAVGPKHPAVPFSTSLRMGPIISPTTIPPGLPPPSCPAKTSITRSFIL
ncbi:MAG TPA: hypothetical protein VK134_05030, partial [Ktedonobacteraceae bacterium]|nr:hypothetical protein [Ktedonobacteraceae bacterium]